MKRTMWSLTYCYEGADNSDPYAVTIAVSEDVELLKREMQKCVDKDCEIDEDDEWADDKNFICYQNYQTEVTLQHRKNTNLYAKYKIHIVEVL